MAALLGTLIGAVMLAGAFGAELWRDWLRTQRERVQRERGSSSPCMRT